VSPESHSRRQLFDRPEVYLIDAQKLKDAIVDLLEMAKAQDSARCDQLAAQIRDAWPAFRRL